MSLVGALVLVLLAAPINTAGAADMLVDLGTFPGGLFSFPGGIDPAGRIVGGADTSGGSAFRAFLWDPATGMQTIGTLGGDAYGNAINAAGEVVGQSALSQSGTGRFQDHAFLWTQSGGMQDLGTLSGGSISRAYGLNGLGHAVGESNALVNQALVFRGFLWDAAGGMQSLGTLPDGGSSVAYGINDAIQVVGQASDASGRSRPFLWTQAGGLQDLGTLDGGSWAIARAINGLGQVVGWSEVTGGSVHAFLWDPASGMRDLGTLAGGTDSQAFGINDAGQVVGGGFLADGSLHALLWDPAGGMRDLGTLPGGHYSVAYGVNAAGQVVGQADNTDGNDHAVRWQLNRPPVANDLSLSTSQDTSIAFTVTASDPDNDPLTWSLVTGPAHGSLSGPLPETTYVPAAGYSGNDSFTFSVNDGTADSNTATVTITVTRLNHPPVADDLSLTTTQDTPVTFTLTGSDPDNDPITFHLVTGPAHGTLTGSLPGGVYTPASGYSGNDSFSFLVNDGTADSNTATVTISVTPAPPPPSPPPSQLRGRMFGEGHLDVAGVRHRFEFRVQAAEAGAERHGTLSYGAGVGAQANHFVSSAITNATFFVDPTLTPGGGSGPLADVVVFSGTGTWNGAPGYTFEARAADAGEPGAGRDSFAITLTAPSGEVVVSVSDLLAGGDIQSLPPEPATTKAHATGH